MFLKWPPRNVDNHEGVTGFIQTHHKIVLNLCQLRQGQQVPSNITLTCKDKLVLAENAVTILSFFFREYRIKTFVYSHFQFVLT